MSQPIKPWRQEVKRDGVTIALIFGWAKLKANDVGEWAEVVGSERSVRVIAEASDSGECVIEGAYVDTEDGVPLHSPFGTELRFRGGAITERVAELTRYLRPRVTDAGEKPFSVTIMVLL